MRLSRRSLVIGGAAAGGILIGWALMPRHFSSPLTPTPDEWAVQGAAPDSPRCRGGSKHDG